MVCGPKGPEETPEGVTNSRNVDRYTELTQRESCWWQRFGISNSAPQQATNTETIALEKGNGDKGSHGVVGDRAAEIDKAKSDTNTASNTNSILWNVPPFVDAGNPVREGESLVSSEGPNIPGDCSKVCHI